MDKIIVAIAMLVLFILYSVMVYTKGTESVIILPENEFDSVQKGKLLYQKYNCQACHQLYGLGGYLGPDLTTAWSDNTRGEAYMRALLQSGGNRMPVFHFTKVQINQIISYLKYVDSTANPTKQ